MFEFRDGATIINQTSTNPNDFSTGEVSPPPSEFEGSSSSNSNMELHFTEKDPYRPIDRTLTFEQAKKEIPFALLIPEYLPQGYSLKEIRSKQFTPDFYIVEQEYIDDNGSSIRITQQSSVKDFASSTGTRLQVKQIEVMGADAILITNETGFCSTSWYKNEFKYDITARISEKEFMKMLGSLRFSE